MPIIILYSWDFGDGYTSNEASPQHNWLRAGTYTVVLTVYLDDGTTTTATTTVVISDSVIVTISQFCLRLAVEPAQGIEWSEISGTDWINPIDALYILDDNDVPRMLLEDEDDNFIWEDSTFDRIQYQQPSYVDKYIEENIRYADVAWIISGSGTAEYRVQKLSGGDPGYGEPKKVLLNGVEATEGTLGSLAAGEWAYGDNDTLGYDTIYVRLIDSTDPDTKAVGWVEAVYWTEIIPEIWYGEDTSDPNAEESMQELTEMHWYTRPLDPNNKGNAAYDAGGYRKGQVFGVDLYRDGALTRPYAEVSQIPENGDITFSGIKLQGRRFMPVFKATCSELMIVGRNLYKVVKPQQGTSIERGSDRKSAELVLALPSFFIGRDRLNPLINRVTGLIIPGTVGIAIGPDTNYGSAIVIPAAGLNLTNAAIAGTYTFMFWRSTTAPVSTVPALPAFTQQGITVNGWQLMYVTGTNCPANLIISQGTVSTIRIYASNVVSYLTIYYNSMIYDNEPKPFEPGL